MNTQQLIHRLKLKPLYEEGGFYTQTYISGEKIAKDALPDRYGDDRPLSTAIYYLLTSDTKSHMHRLLSDEIFHFYLGAPVQMLLLYPSGNSNIIFLGQEIMSGQRVQTLVPGGVWQGCSLVEGGEFALMGTTVAPGFEFEDFELGKRDDLLRMFPQHKDMIEMLTD